MPLPENENPEEFFDGVSEELEEGAQQSTDETNFFNPMLLDLDEEDQMRLTKIVMEDFRNAKMAREKSDWGTDKFGTGTDFETKYAELIDLYEGSDEVRPERWMCGRSLKISQAIVEMLVARLTPSIWDPSLIRWQPVETTDKTRVDAVNEIMDWVINTWMDMEEDVQEIIRATIMMGSAYVETHWDVKQKDLDEIEKTPVVDEAGAPVMDEATGQQMIVEQKLLRTMEKPAVRLIPLTKVYTQPGCTDIQKEPIIKQEDFYYHELEGLARKGLMQNVDSKLKEAVDKSLLNKVSTELAQAERIADEDAKRRASLVETLIWYGNYDADKDGFAEEICCMVSMKEEVYLRSFKTAKVNRKGDRPIRKIDFVSRIHKLLGIGVLEQVKPLAEEIDAVFRQIQDANTLSILKWGFYDPNSDYSPDEHVAKPRAMYPVTNPSQNVFFPDMTVQTERLLNAIRLVLEFVERLTAASSFVMGKEGNFSGGSGTATKTAAIVSSAEVRFNLPTANIRRGLSRVITDIFDLCHLNMPGGLERRILGEDNEPVFETSDDVKAAFLQEMDARLLPNASFGDQNTERELAMMLYDKFVIGGNPFIVGNPEKIYKATARVFEAFKESPAEWLGTAPTAKATNDPIEEQTMIREGHIIHAEPQENHLEHLVTHNQLLNSPDVLLWGKEQLELLRVHMQEHEQMMALVLQFQQGQGGGDGNQDPSGGQAGTAGGAGKAPGEQTDKGSAGPAAQVASNQAQGTTLGTPRQG